MKPICTVLLITYNHAPYVRKCIDSVLSQKTKYPFIIKIFDDASTDGSSDIIREYAKKYPKLIEAHIAEKNTGAQANIWRAYESVDTKYCILTETDDYWCDDEKLQLQIDAMEKHPECSFCGTNTWIVNASIKNTEYENNILVLSNPILKTKKIFSYDDFFPINNGGYIPYQSARILRTEFLHLAEIKYKEVVLFDFNQFYWFLIQGKYYYIDRPTTVYRRLDNGVCSGKSPMLFLSDFIERTVEFNKQTNFKIADKICSEVILQSTFRLYLSEKQKGKFVIRPSKYKRFKYHLLSMCTFGRLRKKYKEKWKLQKAACRGVAK